MGLMDAVKARIMSEATEVLGPGNAPLACVMTDLVHGSTGAGLGDLLQAFADKGLGEVAASWVSQGKNLPVTPDQVQNVLGPEVVAELSAKLGIAPDQLKGLLAQFLPILVDKLTPHGTLPTPPAPPAA